MAGERWRGGVKTVGVLLAGGLLVGGCAAMPSSGPVQRVDAAERAENESPVRIFGVSPQENATQQEIVRGFLEAITSDEAQFDTAREYLTPQRQRVWDPFASTTVLASGPNFTSRLPEGDLLAADGDTAESAETAVVDVGGTLLATVDAAHGYTPQEGGYREPFRLQRVEGEWRIDELPDGLIMSEADFQRNYHSVNTFYYADWGPETGKAGETAKALVADPIYVRWRIDPVGEAVRELLNGPGEWLAPVVRTEIPQDVGLAPERNAITMDSGTLTVALTGVDPGLHRDRCELMGAQVLYTVQEQSSGEVSEVRLTDGADGSRLCSLSRAEANGLAPGQLDARTGSSYFLDGEDRLLTVPDVDAEPQIVTGALGQGAVPLREAAVSRSEDRAAGITEDGRSLLVTEMWGIDPTPEPLTLSASADPETGLSRPSWDGLGDLWVADRDPAGPRLLRLSGGVGSPQEVPVEGLPAGQHIASVRVASDGVRVAMLLAGDDGSATLWMGRIHRAAAGEAVEVSVQGLRAVTPVLEKVTAASWAGVSKLVVVGRPADGVEQLQYLATDGSPASSSTMPGLVTGLAASEDDTLPLLAETADGIVRLQDQWRLVTEQGSAPFYPG
ncbi:MULTISPECIES: LpqB family beta-propeller domain-containing protein [Streptomyces]|uniref:LpqB family beta-propeller domain-containing protein n=1 Tax=Streptomyces TaxID=1883 RepID=UPI0004C8C260|nr:MULTISPECIES: LpqB family beta-propeller domain-containing protein [Streptomyces]